jgi:hypothetical protein
MRETETKEALLDAITNVDPTRYIQAMANIERIEHEELIAYLKTLFDESGAPRPEAWKRVGE